MDSETIKKKIDTFLDKTGIENEEKAEILLELRDDYMIQSLNEDDEDDSIDDDFDITDDDLDNSHKDSDSEEIKKISLEEIKTPLTNNKIKIK